MAATKEVVGYVTTSTGLALNCSGFAPAWVFVKTIIFAITTGLAVFDTYTDWEVVLRFEETGFNNPLLPHNEHWTRAWFLFATIGTILTVTSIFHDSTVLLYSWYKSCKKLCCVSFKCCKKEKSSPTSSTTNTISADSRVHASEYELRTDSESDESEVEAKDDKDEISDPFKCCFRHGWNVTTRNETLGAITLWFQDVPMLTISVLFALVQNSCKTPDTRDASPILQSVGISATASVLASTWRLLRSFVRLYGSVVIRMKDLKFSNPLRRCLPKASEAAYPQDTCAQCCIIPFYCGICMQFAAIAMAVSIVIAIWLLYLFAKTGRNYDDSLGIYRFSLTGPD